MRRGQELDPVVKKFVVALRHKDIDGLEAIFSDQFKFEEIGWDKSQTISFFKKELNKLGNSQALTMGMKRFYCGYCALGKDVIEILDGSWPESPEEEEKGSKVALMVLTKKDEITRLKICTFYTHWEQMKKYGAALREVDEGKG